MAISSADMMLLIPEFNEISDPVWKTNAINTWIECASVGGWETKLALEKIPALIVAEQPAVVGYDLKMVSLIQHTRGVTKCAIGLYDGLSSVYPSDRIPLHRDTVVAGALLHDVGKLIEFSYDVEDDIYVTSERGDILRHPMLGYQYAIKNNVTDEICHIIAYHSFEGTHGIRMHETVIVFYADMANYNPLSLSDTSVNPLVGPS